jgi:hypothetical protein
MPERKPRTLCTFQPVACCSSAIVAPSARPRVPGRSPSWTELYGASPQWLRASGASRSDAAGGAPFPCASAWPWRRADRALGLPVQIVDTDLRALAQCGVIGANIDFDDRIVEAPGHRLAGMVTRVVGRREDSAADVAHRIDAALVRCQQAGDFENRGAWPHQGG